MTAPHPFVRDHRISGFRSSCFRLARRGKTMAERAKRCTLLALISLMLPALCPGADDLYINMAYSSRLFEDVNLSDVKATTKVLIDKIGARSPHFRGGEVQIYHSLAEWRAAAQERVLTLCIISATDFIALEQDGFLEPVFLYEDGSGIGEELLVLVHQQSGIQSIDQVSGREMLIPQNRFAPLARIWLESLNVQPASTHTKGKGGKAILSAFFNRQSACVATRGTYEAMKELNPQIGHQMKILASSPRYIPDVICMSRYCNPDARAFIIETLPTLDSNDTTHQIMVAYGIDRFAPYAPGYLDPMRALLARQERLSSAHAPPSSTIDERE